MAMYDNWCPWCNKICKGSMFKKYGICYKCRRTKDGKKYMQDVDTDKVLEHDYELTHD